MSNQAVDMLKITREGKPVELFMSFGLLNEILPVVNDVGAIALIAVDPHLRNEILKILLSERDENGVITKPVNLFLLKISISDIQLICGWVASHCLDFFLDAIEEVVRTHEPHKSRLQSAGSSMPSGAGLPA